MSCVELEPLRAIQMVKAVEALQRIPHEEVPEGTTFFSDLDQWHYVAIMDERVCDMCHGFDGQVVPGSGLRSLFPYLEIVGIDQIDVHVHINCRCYLEREITK